MVDQRFINIPKRYQETYSIKSYLKVVTNIKDEDKNVTTEFLTMKLDRKDRTNDEKRSYSSIE